MLGSANKGLTGKLTPSNANQLKKARREAKGNSSPDSGSVFGIMEFMPNWFPMGWLRGGMNKYIHFWRSQKCLPIIFDATSEH